MVSKFLLTPLREGRLEFFPPARQCHPISTHAPAGGATCRACVIIFVPVVFLLTPLREGRPEKSA